MDADNCLLASGLVSKAYISQGAQALSSRRAAVKALLSSRRMPQRGWDEATIEMLIQDAALMDSNNFPASVGVGEREARIACPLVARRNFRLAHGIGRSGDIAAEQPKAAGSSLLAKLAGLLATDALRLAGLQDVGALVLLPLATGMALTMALLALKSQCPPQARYVVWSRIDQKTCLKCVTAANLELVVVELCQSGDQLGTDVQAIEAAITSLGADSVVCVMTTTSCFAPRGSDDVVAVAKLCARLDVPHLINHAYGVQSLGLCQSVTSAWRKGRVDGIVSSTDKNFMVPVGGALLAAGKGRTALVEAVRQRYPGRAAVSAHLDLLLTLLHWGAEGWCQVLKEREGLFPYLKQRLCELAAEHGERVLDTPDNPISIAMTLDSLQPAEADPEEITMLGSMLWVRGVSGVRAVATTAKPLAIAGVTMRRFGSHSNSYPHSYLTAAAAVGTTQADIDEFCARLRQCFSDYRKQQQQRRLPVVDNTDEVASNAVAENEELVVA